MGTASGEPLPSGHPHASSCHRCLHSVPAPTPAMPQQGPPASLTPMTAVLQQSRHSSRDLLLLPAAAVAGAAAADVAVAAAAVAGHLAVLKVKHHWSRALVMWASWGQAEHPR